MIVFTSDHGDYLGDHWMGEKDLFHDQSVKVPLIIYDPRKEANKTRGTENNELVESIDLAPTFLDYFSGKSKPQILEGRNLAPLLHNQFHEHRLASVCNFGIRLLYERGKANYWK